jgi:gliding motility-associated-like protein
VDGNSLVKIMITSLPANGTLKLNGTAVTLNQEMLATDLGKLTFDPNPNCTGTTSFGWNGSDGSLYALVAARVNITVLAVNHPPVVAGFTETIDQNQALPFAPADFTAVYTDPDNNSLVSIRVDALPTNGKLTLNGLDVTVGQVIILNDLVKLIYTPAKDYSGEDSFRWIAFDGVNYSVSLSTVRITIKPFDVFIPEGFSPNGDGVNDYFVIKGADRYIITLKVFNRWSNKVYESSHYKNDWDGTAEIGLLVSGGQLPGGTYFYTANFNNGEKEIIGYLTINR